MKGRDGRRGDSNHAARDGFYIDIEAVSHDGENECVVRYSLPCGEKVAETPADRTQRSGQPVKRTAWVWPKPWRRTACFCACLRENHCLASWLGNAVLTGPGHGAD